MVETQRCIVFEPLDFRAARLFYENRRTTHIKIVIKYACMYAHVLSVEL